YLTEADEQARLDDPDNLALERLLPAAVEQLALEQPREAELVGPVLDPGGGSLLQRRVLGEGVEVGRRGIVGGTELAKERPVADQIWVAADRRGEVAVGAARKARVAEVLGMVARLLERPEHELRKRVATAGCALDILRDA